VLKAIKDNNTPTAAEVLYEDFHDFSFDFKDGYSSNMLNSWAFA
jgi:hypothetical protein